MSIKNENSTKIIDRLTQFVDFKHDNFNKLSQNIGVSNSYFSKMVRNNGSIGSELLSKIVIYYDDLNIDWLITGEGNMQKKTINVSSSKSQVQPDQAPGSECKLCKEKDQRINDLQKSIEMWETNFKSLSNSFQCVVDTQNSVIHSLQDQLDDLQQLQLDTGKDVTSQAG